LFEFRDGDGRAASGGLGLPSADIGKGVFPPSPRSPSPKLGTNERCRAGSSTVRKVARVVDVNVLCHPLFQLEVEEGFLFGELSILVSIA
jgi:hypothetical protein